jgi:hypothetical protein
VERFRPPAVKDARHGKVKSGRKKACSVREEGGGGGGG